MRTSTSSVEHDVDLIEHRQARQPLDTFMSDSHPHALGACQTVRSGVDADHRSHFNVLTMPEYLDHQVGADITATNDGSLDFAGHGDTP